MTAQIIDGKAIALRVRHKTMAQIEVLREKYALTLGLAVILVGDDIPSQIYVRNKERTARAMGIESHVYRMPADTTEDTLLKEVAALNNNPSIHGILVQLPLPKQIDAKVIIGAIDPAKDVDGLHPFNAGRLASNMPALAPCTPLGCVTLLQEAGITLKGRHAVVIGRSNLVGKPLAQLLLKEDASVTILHSKTHEPWHIAETADIVIAAVGQTHLVKQHWLKKGAVVLDVGINRKADGTLTGDVDFDNVLDLVSHITPVPGGIGPMTIACLMVNTLQAGCHAHGIILP
jgi:methylenetetrahydrofolate dehydrogenase (NADP+)/methenyltetrahydrofolate cyclohydrolase